MNIQAHIIKAIAEQKYFWPRIDKKFDEINQNIKLQRKCKTYSVINELKPLELLRAIKLLFIIEVLGSDGKDFVGSLFEKVFKKEIEYCENNKDTLTVEKFMARFGTSELSYAQINTLLTVYIYIRQCLNLPSDKSNLLSEYLSAQNEISNIYIEFNSHDLSNSSLWLKHNSNPTTLNLLSYNEKVFDNNLRVFELITKDENIPMQAYENYEISKKELCFMISLFKQLESENEKYNFNQLISLAYMFKSLAKYAEECKNSYLDLSLSPNISPNYNLKRNIRKLEEEIGILQQSIQEKQDSLNELQIKYDRQTRNLESAKTEISELTQFIEKLSLITDQAEESNENCIPIATDDLINIKKYKFVIIGGHINWQNKISNILPNSIIIPTDKNNFDINILKNADSIIFNFSHCSHKLFYKMQQNCNLDKVIYINDTNIDKLLTKINNKIKASD